MTDDASRSDTAFRPLTIIELCLSDGCGGLERYAARMVSELSARGHRVLAVSKPGSEFARLIGNGASLEIRPHRLLPAQGARRLAKLARCADVVHIHRSADLPSAALAKRLAHRRPSLIYTRHMAITRDRRRSPVHRLLHREVDLLLAITERVAAEARMRLPLDAGRIRVLPLGIPPPPPPAARESVRPTGRDFVVGCFSRIEPAKGQHEFLAALARLVERGIDAAALVVGPVMDRAYFEDLLRRCRELGVAERVRFPGMLPAVQPVMACCDAVAMPSAAETFGLVLVEAMQMGVPVVASQAGGVAEIVAEGETGLTYPPGHPAALAEQLERLARNPEWARKIAEAGRQRALEHYRLDDHVDRLVAWMRSTREGDRGQPTC